MQVNVNTPTYGKDDFKILNGNYKSSIRRKFSETLYITTLKPTLNVKEKSIKLKLN